MLGQLVEKKTLNDVFRNCTQEQLCNMLVKLSTIFNLRYLNRKTSSLVFILFN